MRKVRHSLISFAIAFAVMLMFRPDSAATKPQSDIFEPQHFVAIAPSATGATLVRFEDVSWNKEKLKCVTDETGYTHHVLLNGSYICDRCDEYVPPRYGFTYEEVYLLSQLLCGSYSYDGDGEYDFVWQAIHTEVNYYEVSKVLCVVMNRVRDDRFPNTVTDVVMQKGQFAVMPRNAEKLPSDIAVQKVQEWCDAYDSWDLSVQCIPEDHLFFRAGPHLTNVTRVAYR